MIVCALADCAAALNGGFNSRADHLLRAGDGAPTQSTTLVHMELKSVMVVARHLTVRGCGQQMCTFSIKIDG
jgi:hypothetical protein